MKSIFYIPPLLLELSKVPRYQVFNTKICSVCSFGNILHLQSYIYCILVAPCCLKLDKMMIYVNMLNYQGCIYL